MTFGEGKKMVRFILTQISFFLLNLGPFGRLRLLQDREGQLDPSQGQKKGGRATQKKKPKGQELGGLKCDDPTIFYAAFSNLLTLTETYKTVYMSACIHNTYNIMGRYSHPGYTKKFLPRRTSACTTGRDLLWCWWPRYNPTY